MTEEKINAITNQILKLQIRQQELVKKLIALEVKEQKDDFFDNPASVALKNLNDLLALTAPHLILYRRIKNP